MVQPDVVGVLSSSYSGTKVVDPDRLQIFKNGIEAHITLLTTAVQNIEQHANWIEPRLHEFIKFMTWMQEAHPDIIDAYKKTTAVAEKLDRANDEMIYPMSSPPEMMGS
jgi:hypothetical protein